MIQRRQTLWLLLASAAAILSFMFPFVTGKEMIKNMMQDKIVDAGSNFFILLLTGASLVLSTVIIFLFKNRKQQMQLCLLGILVAVIVVVLYFLQFNKLTKPVLALSCILPFAMIAGYILAFRDIRKDEKLVKSLDKLR
jgi:predicted MFS family arabinose efflux permease